MATRHEWEVDRIMLRYRPIAPKPPMAPPPNGLAAGDGAGKKKRHGDAARSSARKSRREKSGSSASGVVTLLPLMPEVPESMAAAAAPPPPALWKADVASSVDWDADVCPGFVSDEWGRVTWTNRAYRRMFAGAGEEDEWTAAAPPPVGACGDFTTTCTVRVWYTCPGGKEWSTMAAPCDVWRLSGGGGLFWRLDSRAALSLGCGGR